MCAPNPTVHRPHAPSLSFSRFYSKHPNTTPTRDSVRVATVPFAFSTWRYSPSTYSEKSRSPVTNHGQTTPMLGFPPVYRYAYGTSKPQTRPVDAISPFSNMAHSAPRRVACGECASSPGHVRPGQRGWRVSPWSSTPMGTPNRPRHYHGTRIAAFHPRFLVNVCRDV